MIRAGCLALAAAAVGAQPPAQPVAIPGLAALFSQAKVRGTFVLLEPGSGRLLAHDARRAQRRYVPASTFKILNSLIALDTGVVRDEDEVVPYGGQAQPVKAWERDMSMRDAIQISAVPIYQELARRVGLERMGVLVAKAEFGNGDIGKVIDRFWLDGPLKVSAVEEARFVARLAHNQLPFSARAQAKVRELLWVASTPEYRLYAKTGWYTKGRPGIGWYTGWVERAGKVYAFSLNLDVVKDGDQDRRQPIALAALKLLGALG